MRLLIMVFLVLTLVQMLSAPSHAGALDFTQKTHAVRLVIPALIDNETGSDIVRYFEDPLAPKETIIYLKGFGGLSMEMVAVINAMKDYQQNGGHIEAIILGPTYSALSVIACQADKITIKTGGSLQFHSTGNNISIFYGLLTYRQQTMNPEYIHTQINAFNTCVTKKIITAADVNLILQGYAITYTKTDLGTLRSVADDVGISNLLFDCLQLLIILLGSLFILKIVAIIIRGVFK